MNPLDLAPVNKGYLLIETALVTDVLYQVYTLSPDCEWGYLYQDTELAHLKEQGPIWVEVEPDSRLLQHQQQDDHWRANSSLVTNLGADKNAIISHLKSLVTLNTTQGARWLFRFHHPSVLMKLSQSLTAQERSNFTSAIMGFHFQYVDPDEQAWHTSSILPPEPSNTTATLTLSANTMEQLLA